ncbi:hypothetical protein GCM10010435_81190 [Winogradskya consettensis]
MERRARWLSVLGQTGPAQGVRHRAAVEVLRGLAAAALLAAALPRLATAAATLAAALTAALTATARAARLNILGAIAHD